MNYWYLFQLFRKSNLEPHLNSNETLILWFSHAAWGHNIHRLRVHELLFLLCSTPKSHGWQSHYDPTSWATVIREANGKPPNYTFQRMSWHIEKAALEYYMTRLPIGAMESRSGSVKWSTRQMSASDLSCSKAALNRPPNKSCPLSSNMNKGTNESGVDKTY